MKIDGKKIEILQAKKGLTLSELSELSGLGGSAICSIIRGEREPRPVTVGKLARALKVEIEDILIQE